MIETSLGADRKVLILSTRLLERRVFNSFIYEFEDVVAQMENAIICPVRSKQAGKAFRLGTRLLNSAISGTCLHQHRMGLFEEESLDYEVDLLVVPVLSAYQCDILKSLPRWRERCKHAIAVLFEFWPPLLSHVPTLAGLGFLKGFDHVSVANATCVPMIEDCTGEPASYLTYAVDAFRFCPESLSSSRPVDVYYLGRRSPVTHSALVDLSRDPSFFYYYSTVTDGEIGDHVSHQELKAVLLKKTKFFVAYPHNWDKSVVVKTGGINELSLRLFEGAAAGTVMLGGKTDCPAFEEYFGWEDAIIDIPYEASNIQALLNELQKQPDRLASIRRHNVCQTLLKNDWAYRWMQILQSLNLPPTNFLRNRVEALHQWAGRLATT
jgi:hypothetical protein